jgi:hypothetical protein
MGGGGDKSQISQANDSAGETDLGIISEVNRMDGQSVLQEISYAWWTKLSYTFKKLRFKVALSTFSREYFTIESAA